MIWDVGLFMCMSLGCEGRGGGEGELSGNKNPHCRIFKHKKGAENYFE